jgi:microcystin degradation protein MlrC
MSRPRIAIAGIHIESSTFSPHRAGDADFDVRRGDGLLASYPFLAEPGFADADWVGLLHARALPGGPVLADTYARLSGELLDRLRAALPLDGVFLDIHGAMSVDGLDDAEARLVAEVRAAVGPDCLLSAGMDLHGNMSPELIGLLDLATAHRMAPHEDAPLTRRRAAGKLLGCLRDGVRPVRAWVSVPVLLPGERTSTRLEPAKSIYAALPAVEARPAVIDAAIWVGYAWADEPRCRAAVVVSGTDRDTVGAAAQRLARSYWEARQDFSFGLRTGSAADCVAAGLASTARPFIISDSGDNPTAGGAGDVPYMLRELLATPRLAAGEATAIAASIQDPAAVAACVAAGAGNPVSVAAGGRIDTGHGDPVPLDGTVFSIVRDDPVGGDIAVVRVGGVHAILTSRRKPYHHVADFTSLGLEPAGHDLTVVKIGYLEPELHEIAADRMLALTPGGVDQHLLRLPYRRLDRPVHPLDPDMPDPDLTPTVFAS